MPHYFLNWIYIGIHVTFYLFYFSCSLNLRLYSLYIFILHLYTPMPSFIHTDFRGYIGPVPIVPLLLAIGTVIGAITFISTDKDTIPKYHNVIFSHFYYTHSRFFLYLYTHDAKREGKIGFAFQMQKHSNLLSFLVYCCCC